MSNTFRPTRSARSPRKDSVQVPEPAGPRREALVAKAIADIRELYRLGQQIVQRTSVPQGQSVWGKELFKEELKRLGLKHETTLRKAKQFAAVYSAEDLEGLIEMIEAHEPRKNTSLPIFGPSAVKVLLTAGPDKVADKDVSELRKLQERAIKGAWSTAKLEGVIRATKKRLRKGGRRPELPDDLAGLKVRIASSCRTWQRLVKTATHPDKNLDLGAKLRELLEQADRVVGKVLAAVEA